MEADGVAEPVLKNVRLEVSTRLKIMWHNLLEMEDHVENPRDTSENTTQPNPAETIAMILEQFDFSALQEELGNDVVKAVREMRWGDDLLDETLEPT
jgi:hypothetical protein